MATPTAPPADDPTAPKPWYSSKTTWLGALLTLLGVSTYFADPIHTPAMTLASVSEAVGGVGAIVLRVWFTSAPIAGTGGARRASMAHARAIDRAVAVALLPPRRSSGGNTA